MWNNNGYDLEGAAHDGSNLGLDCRGLAYRLLTCLFLPDLPGRVFHKVTTPNCLVDDVESDRYRIVYHDLSEPSDPDQCRRPQQCPEASALTAAALPIAASPVCSLRICRVARCVMLSWSHLSAERALGANFLQNKELGRGLAYRLLPRLLLPDLPGRVSNSKQQADHVAGNLTF